jgi:hypothetical protein
LNDIHHAVTPYVDANTPMVFEAAFPWNVFTENSLGVNNGASTPVFTPFATTGVRLNLSQSFGYSVAGGSGFYGTDRLGIVTTPVPEPSVLALSAVGFACLVGLRRYRRSH